MSYAHFPWRLYNILRRLVGLMAVLAGVAFLWSAGSQWLQVRAPETHEAGPVAELLVALVCGVFGGLFLSRRTYRPDQGDVSWWAGRAGEILERRAECSARRSWWTGEERE